LKRKEEKRKEEKRKEEKGSNFGLSSAKKTIQLIF